MKTVLTTIFLSVIATITLSAQTLTGTVTEVIDGNTIILNSNKVTFKIRLQFIDPPEAGQPLHDVVKAHLSTLALNKRVSVGVKSVSQGLHIGRVYLDGRDLGMQLLRDGGAWYSHPEASNHQESERLEYLSMESQAKAEKRGIWGVANITPAWELRIAREKARNEQLKKEYDQAIADVIRGALSRPVVGMTEAAFRLVCGSESGDKIGTSQGTLTYNVNYSMVVTDRRKSTGCFGRFNFEEGRLRFISRDYEVD